MKGYQSLVLAVLVLFAAGCQEEKKIQVSNPKPKPAKVMTIDAGQQYIKRLFSGKVVAAQKATLSFEVPGKLNQFPVLEGSTLKKGDLIAAIDDLHYQETLKESGAKFDFAKAQFDRAEKLIKNNFISQNDYDLLKSKLNIASANLSSAQKNVKDTVLYAPFDGVVVKTYVENFEYIKAKQNIVLLQDLSDIDVEIFVPEYIILQMKQKSELNPRVIFSVVNKSYPATLKEFSSQADPTTQTYRAVFTLKAPEDINILPGMSVNLELTLPDFKTKSQSYYLIPVDAVFSGDDKQPKVWLVDPKTHQIHAKSIETGDLTGQSIKILKGLEQGQMIVVAGVHHLREGQEIKPLETKD